MKILVTGADGFVGKNLCARLCAIRDGRDPDHVGLVVEEVLTYHHTEPTQRLRKCCAEADLVFHLAGVNRARDASEFRRGNVDFTAMLLETLKECGNACPIVFASSVQACRTGRFDARYADSKCAAEELLFAYAGESGAQVRVYRLPNLFGKWCKPNYNSVVATFCHCVACDLALTVDEREAPLQLLYIDDLIQCWLADILREPRRCSYVDGTAVADENGRYCMTPRAYRVTVGEIADMLTRFRGNTAPISLPNLTENSFEKKLYATYLSYLPQEKMRTSLLSHTDVRGSFTELLTLAGGQLSVNVANPHITKGRHWHQSKWEIFAVVSGRGRIRLRHLDAHETVQFDVSGEKIEAVHIPPGYVHEITNLSDTEPLVTLIWAGERYVADRADTFYAEVDE